VCVCVCVCVCRQCKAGYRTRRQAGGRKGGSSAAIRARLQGGAPGEVHVGVRISGPGGLADPACGATPILRYGADGQLVGAAELEAEVAEIRVSNSVCSVCLFACLLVFLLRLCARTKHRF
jgi:hypothetical protein